MKEKEFYNTVFKEMLVNGESVKERVDAQTRFATTERKRIRIPRRVWIAGIVFASLLIIGSAAAAASVWIARSNYTPSEYLQQGPDDKDKTAIPDMEEARQASRPQDVSYEIRMQPEIDYDHRLAAWREQMGAKPYDEEDWRWIRDLKPAIGDVLYDGNMLYVTTVIETDHIDLLKNDVWIGCSGGTYTVEGDPTVYPIHLFGEDRWNGYTDHSLIVDAKVDLSQETFPERGIVTMTENLYVVDGTLDGEQMERSALGLMTVTFSFDASSFRPVSEPVHIAVPLSGTYTVTMQEYCNENSIDPTLIQNKKLALDDVTLDAQVEYRTVGIYLTITVKDAPKAWTDYEKTSLLLAIEDAMESEMNTRYRINGGEPNTPENLPYGADGFIYLLLPVYPSEYQTVSSLTVDLNLKHTVAVNGGTPSEDFSWSFGKDGGILDQERRTEPLVSFEIPIPGMN